MYMSLVEEELPTLPEHLRSSLDCNEVCGTRSLVVYVCFVDRCLTSYTFSVGHFGLRYTDADYQFDVFRLFLT